MLNYHDASIQRFDISMVPGEWHIALSVTVEGRGIVVTFDRIWWIGVHGLAMISNESQVDWIDDTGWDGVPENCRFERGGYRAYTIQLISGSKLIVVAQAIIECPVSGTE
jgi:hypothetical protein